MTYVVIDLETTGPFPDRRDRVVELAVVHVSAEGEVVSTWSTLVDPGRDLGLEHVHGILPADVRRAPSFGDIAGVLADHLTGRVLVSHDLAFDARFLRAEYERIGHPVPIDEELGLCTMELAAIYLPRASRSLASSCDAAGVARQVAHHAYFDACAAAGLLRHYLGVAGRPAPWSSLFRSACTRPWPDVPRRAFECVNRAGAAAAPHFLERLTDQLPRASDKKVERYLALLDRALLGRCFSMEDADAIVAFADELGVDRERAERIHVDYLLALARVACEDRVIAPGERADLRAVAALLGLFPGDADRAIHLAATTSAPPGPRPERLRQRAGDVCTADGERRAHPTRQMRRRTPLARRLH